MADWLRVEGNERFEKVHVDKLGALVARHFRKSATGVHGAGLLNLPTTPTYNSGTRRLTFPATTTGVDVDGNLIYLDDALETEPIAASDVGVAPLYVWAAVELAATPASNLPRVEWVDDTPPERTRARNTELRDRVSLVVAALQPPDTASGTKYFPLVKYLAWSGSPSAPSSMQPWWTVNSWREKLTTGYQFDGVIPMLGELIVRLADNLIGTAGEWSGAAGDTAHPNALNTLDGRIAPLEAWRAALDAYWADGNWQNVPLTAMQATGDWEWYSSRVWRTSDVNGYVYAELTWPAWRKAHLVRIRVLPSAGIAVGATLIRTNKLTQSNDTLDSATAPAGESQQTLSLSFGEDAQNLSDEGYTYHLVLSASGSASGTAVVYAVSLSTKLSS